MMRRRHVKTRWLLALAVLAACGDDPVAVADPALAPFVGDWDATALTITSVANPETVVDLPAQGATFSINVQPSGAYTAVLIFARIAQTELGVIEVQGSTITLRRNFPTSQVNASTYEFRGPSVLVMDGDTEFDFNLDGTPEAGLAHFELAKR